LRERKSVSNQQKGGKAASEVIAFAASGGSGPRKACQAKKKDRCLTLGRKRAPRGVFYEEKVLTLPSGRNKEKKKRKKKK